MGVPRSVRLTWRWLIGRYYRTVRANAALRRENQHLLKLARGLWEELRARGDRP